MRTVSVGVPAFTVRLRWPVGQHDWAHTVPKTTRGGPRISVTYRHTSQEPFTAPRR